MLADVATSTVVGDRVVHHVEAAWSPRWDLDLARPFRLAGTTLTLSGAPGVDHDTGEAVIFRMEFEKV